MPYLQGEWFIHYTTVGPILNYYTEGKSLAIYFGDSRYRRNRTFNLKVSKLYVDKRSHVR